MQQVPVSFCLRRSKVGIDTYPDGVGMRVDPVNDHLVERPLERHLRDLALLQAQLPNVVRAKHRGLRWGLDIVERLRRRLRALLRRRALHHARHAVERRRAGRERRRDWGGRWRREVRRRAEEPDDRWVAVVQLGHRVEQMGDEARAGLDGRGREASRCDTEKDQRPCQVQQS